MKILLSGLMIFLCQCQSTISGKVLSPEGLVYKKIEGKINIAPLDHEGNGEILDIGKDGEFQTQKELVAGEYLIEPLIPGYQSSSIRVKVSDSKTVILYAKPRPEKQAKMIQDNRDFKEDIGQGGVLIAPPKF